jgi:hypothetical protein
MLTHDQIRTRLEQLRLRALSMKGGESNLRDAIEIIDEALAALNDGDEHQADRLLCFVSGMLYDPNNFARADMRWLEKPKAVEPPGRFAAVN